MVTNGASQLILSVELRRRHNAQLQAEPLAAWEQCGPEPAWLVPHLWGHAPSIPPTSLGYSSSAFLQMPVCTMPEHAPRQEEVFPTLTPSPLPPRIPLPISGHGNSQWIPGQESPSLPSVSAQTCVSSIRGLETSSCPTSLLGMGS